MAEQQLVDYIKKAKDAGQSDEQTRALLYKNGWTEAEVAEAFSAGQTATQPQIQPQPQVVAQPRVEEPKIVEQPKYQPQPQQPQQQYQPKPQAQPVFEPEARPEPIHDKGSLGLIIKIIIAILLLAIIGTGGYYAMTQTDLAQNFVTKILSFFPSTTPAVTPVATTQTKTPAPVTTQPATPKFATVKLGSVLADYDMSKITAFSFSTAGDKVVYCAPNKTTGKTSCFLNDQNLGNTYSFKPYWVGISPDGKRIVFLYYDLAKKQSFTYENGKEGAKYDGTITSPGFTLNSQNFLFVVITPEGKNYVVLNDKPGNMHDKVFTVPTISSDGKFVLYGARDGQDISWVADPIAK